MTEPSWVRRFGGFMSDLWDAIPDWISSMMNYNQDKKNLDWEKTVQKENWSREDNAVQRRVQDLDKAGLSPTLAAGSAAGAGQVVNTQAPHLNAPQSIGLNDALTSAQMIYNMMTQSTQIHRTEAETRLIEQNTKRADIGTKNDQLAYSNGSDFKDFMHRRNLPVGAAGAYFSSSVGEANTNRTALFGDTNSRDAVAKTDSAVSHLADRIISKATRGLDRNKADSRSFRR